MSEVVVHLPEVANEVNHDKIMAFEDQPDYEENEQAGEFSLQMSAVNSNSKSIEDDNMDQIMNEIEQKTPPPKGRLPR